MNYNNINQGGYNSNAQGSLYRHTPPSNSNPNPQSFYQGHQSQQQQQQQQQNQQMPYGMNMNMDMGQAQMLGNLAAHAGKGTFDKVMTKMTPGAQNTWMELRERFSVSSQSVMNKIKLVLVPFLNKKNDWSRKNIDDNNNNSSIGSPVSKMFALPRDDVNAPELYLPMMSFITYVLLCGYVKGTANSFTPEVLIQTLWRCLLLQLVETCVIRICINFMSVSTITFLDVLAYTGYKYVGLCFTVPIGILGYWIANIYCIYQAVALFYFVLKTLADATKPQRGVTNNSFGPPRWVMVSSFAASQFFLSLLLVYS